MPGVLELRIGDPRRGRIDPTPMQLHGLVSTLLDESDTEHVAAHKPWSAWLARDTPERLTIRIGWLAAAPPRLNTSPAVRLGPGTYPVLAREWRPTTFAHFASQPCEEVGLEFLSPTWFSRAGTALPFPMPTLVFGRLAEKWNQYCEPDQHLPAQLREALLDAVELASWSGQTWRMDFGRGQRSGFVGRMVTGLNTGAANAALGPDHPPASAELADLLPTVLGALAGFAELAGVGAQTPYGAGRVRVVR